MQHPGDRHASFHIRDGATLASLLLSGSHEARLLQRQQQAVTREMYRYYTASALQLNVSDKLRQKVTLPKAKMQNRILSEAG